MKIMYMMNVDWRWIKQRPHFLAEGLAQNNEVLLYYPYSYHRNEGMFCENLTDVIKPHKYYNLPFRRRTKIINVLNNVYLRLYFAFIIFIKRPEIIWIGGDPDVACYLSKSNQKKAVYDCMDDYYAMSNNKEVLKNEKKIVNNCKHIFVSSLSLENKLVERFNIDRRKITLVRNGYDGNIIKNFIEKSLTEQYKIAYIGTISSWFDFDLIDFIVKKTDNVQFHIVGPVKPVVADKCKTLETDKVIFYGSIEHDFLYKFVSTVDCLIMPFQINDIILSVDPVKLYEYVNFKKNIICVGYPEIKRFSDFVNFYNTKEEALEVVKRLQSNKKLIYSDDARERFLDDNTWDNRMRTVFCVLNNQL